MIKIVSTDRRRFVNIPQLILSQIRSFFKPSERKKKRYENLRIRIFIAIGLDNILIKALRDGRIHIFGVGGGLYIICAVTVHHIECGFGHSGHGNGRYIDYRLESFLIFVFVFIFHPGLLCAVCIFYSRTDILKIRKIRSRHSR